MNDDEERHERDGQLTTMFAGSERQGDNRWSGGPRHPILRTHSATEKNYNEVNEKTHSLFVIGDTLLANE